MKTLVLLRHAKAERSSDTGRDFDRALTERGRADAALMGRVLAERGIKPDRALVSSARRTTETWEQASASFGDAEVAFDRGLYHAEPNAIRRAVEAIEEEAGVLIVVGHNPGIHQYAVELMVESAAAPSMLDRMTRFPTAAAAVFGVDPAGRAAFEALHLPETYGGGADA
jgi:phosphohistidine phosphatase